MSSILLGLQRAEELPGVIRQEFEQLGGALQNAWMTREAGKNVSLLLGLQFREQLPTIVAEELDQWTAAIQTAFNRQVWVKRTVRGTLTIATGSQSQSATIPNESVILANTLLTHAGVSTNADGDPYTPDSYETYLSLSADGSTITATRGNSSASYTCTTSYVVTEFHPGLFKSIQRGTITFTSPNTTATATIQAVSTDRVIVEMLGYSTDYTDGGVEANNRRSDVHKVRLALTNATTLTATTNSGGSQNVVGYQVVEYF